MSSALVVIDVKNDYVPGGESPLWQPEAAGANCLRLIDWAKAAGVSVIHVHHIVEGVPAPFFAAGSNGAEIREPIRKAAPDAPVIVKARADSFEKTKPRETFESMCVERLILRGMMSRNCVTHTAISNAADACDIAVVSDACTSIGIIPRLPALHALAVRLKLTDTARLVSKEPH